MYPHVCEDCGRPNYYSKVVCYDCDYEAQNHWLMGDKAARSAATAQIEAHMAEQLAATKMDYCVNNGVIKECVECGLTASHDVNDYLCILCRESMAESVF